MEINICYLILITFEVSKNSDEITPRTFQVVNYNRKRKATQSQPGENHEVEPSIKVERDDEVETISFLENAGDEPEEATTTERIETIGGKNDSVANAVGPDSETATEFFVSPADLVLSPHAIANGSNSPIPFQYWIKNNMAELEIYQLFKIVFYI